MANDAVTLAMRYYTPDIQRRLLYHIANNCEGMTVNAFMAMWEELETSIEKVAERAYAGSIDGVFENSPK